MMPLCQNITSKTIETSRSRHHFDDVLLDPSSCTPSSLSSPPLSALFQITTCTALLAEYNADVVGSGGVRCADGCECTFDSDQVACVCEVLHQSGDIDRLVCS
ncbi:unnamed protein product [Gongylonema pulchrum]|uniref:CFEM domain-containing protein n=1 Tax=Gongylonema pulchrum TaxID=637853 RepID=A0A183D455_9BILA|nr:unnamed protein product [Gongylonema pulchrum]